MCAATLRCALPGKKDILTEAEIDWGTRLERSKHATCKTSLGKRCDGNFDWFCGNPESNGRVPMARAIANSNVGYDEPLRPKVAENNTQLR
ncbi:hypothetical protein WN48_07216 [Eufriesea mexicana]|uniref:Uncharacterized protein n=1 Tax=Eufriesea mexicana TaxID=516756 RepID=A0A310SVB2_9HYME|nr:hypothetical protein WN48_07216 [Eufriesea mexicana]